MTSKPGTRALVVHAADLGDRQLALVRAAVSDLECLSGPTLGDTARRVRAALDDAPELGRGWCIVIAAAGRPLGALVSTKLSHFFHVSVAGLTMIGWRP